MNNILVIYCTNTQEIYRSFSTQTMNGQYNCKDKQNCRLIAVYFIDRAGLEAVAAVCVCMCGKRSVCGLKRNVCWEWEVAMCVRSCVKKSVCDCLSMCVKRKCVCDLGGGVYACL